MLRYDVLEIEENKKTLIVCSRNRLFRDGLKYILNSDNFIVKLEYNSLVEFHTNLKDNANQISLVICETHEGFCDDHETLGRLTSEFPQISVVVLADQVSQRDFDMAVRSGVKGFLPKNISAEALKMSLTLILLGEDIFTAPAQLKSSGSLPQRQPDSGNLRTPLSQKEGEILECLQAGLSNKAIARELDMAEATVKVHVKAILRKINVENRTQAAVWGMANQHSRIESEAA